MPSISEPEWGVSAGEAGGEPPAGYAEAFALSMPSRYSVLFDPRSIRRHAAVAFRRAGKPAHAEVWRSLPDGAGLCVVAEDRPGLLSAIAAALVSHRLDVITALVFSRVADGGEHEAVDLLWVRRAAPGDTAAIGAEEAISIGEVLSAILRGTITIEEIASRAHAEDRAEDESIDVRFDDVDEEGQAVLLVEAADRPGMLLTIAFEVFQQGSQIVRSLVRTADHRAYNRFVLAEFSGASLTEERRAQLRAAVFAALALKAGSRT